MNVEGIVIVIRGYLLEDGIDDYLLSITLNKVKEATVLISGMVSRLLGLVRIFRQFSTYLLYVQKKPYYLKYP